MTLAKLTGMENLGSLIIANRKVMRGDNLTNNVESRVTKS